MILSGGPASVIEGESPRAPQEVFTLGVPVLAICYGQQTMAVQLGGKVEGGHAREFGRADVEILRDSPLFEGFWEVGGKYPVWMSHGDRVTQLPQGFAVVGTSENAPFAIAVDEQVPFLQRDVSPRSGAHARWRQTAAQLHAQDRRLQRRLDDGGVQGRSDRAHPRASGQGHV